MKEDEFFIIVEPDIDFYHIATLITSQGKRRFSINKNNLRKLHYTELISLSKACDESIKSLIIYIEPERLNSK